MLKAVIFDMDGVLLDSEPYHYFIEGEIYKSLGINIPEKIRVNFVGLGNKEMWTFIKNKYGLKQSIEELSHNNDRERFAYMSKLTGLSPNPGILQLLEILKNNKIKIALASSSPKNVINILIDKISLTEYFDIMVSGDEFKNGKPEPDIFIQTAKLLRENAADCIVIEDSTNGIKAAKAAKMKCIAYKNKGTRGQDISMADLMIDDFTKLDIVKMKNLV